MYRCSKNISVEQSLWCSQNTNTSTPLLSHTLLPIQCYEFYIQISVVLGYGAVLLVMGSNIRHWTVDPLRWDHTLSRNVGHQRPNGPSVISRQKRDLSCTVQKAKIHNFFLQDCVVFCAKKNMADSTFLERLGSCLPFLSLLRIICPFAPTWSN